MPRLSKTQKAVVLKLREQGNAPIVRWPGGFWTFDGCQALTGKQAELYQRDDPKRPVAIPEWSVTVQTVRALENMGYLTRLLSHPEEWRDSRGLTELGKTFDLEGERTSC